jgi:Na+/phosphate symporter
MDCKCPKVPLGLTPMNFISAVKRMKETENLKAEMIYVDILNEMERIGKDALNVVHALNHRV